jgi:hypothetical protein
LLRYVDKLNKNGMRKGRLKVRIDETTNERSITDIDSVVQTPTTQEQATKVQGAETSETNLAEELRSTR